jgi:hypothetical protein
MKKEEKPTLMGEEPPQGREQTPFRRGAALIEERTLQEGKWQSSTIEEERTKNPNF